MKIYLGDGAYAHFDGYQIWIETYNGIQVTNSVALEPLAWKELIRWVKENLPKAYQP